MYFPIANFRFNILFYKNFIGIIRRKISQFFLK